MYVHEDMRQAAKRMVFWILRVTIYSRIHKSYAPYFAFPFPYFSSSTWDQENLDDDGFSHTLSTVPAEERTLSAQLKNPGGPYQNLEALLQKAKILKNPFLRMLSHKSFVLFYAVQEPKHLTKTLRGTLSCTADFSRVQRFILVSIFWK